jgi:dolichol-phosphate mannosyltransferase
MIPIEKAGRPSSELYEFSQRRGKIALVIPVLNEGRRIIGQLEKLQELGAALDDIDIILADGRSTDGSMEPDRLKALGVRALLVKTGPGRQGAQFRMALGWALDEGYDAFITMDGNGKDDVSGILAIRERLFDGYDYVQGSRYAPGGEGVNTPLDRKIMGRYVHAPICSLASGRWMTDTTNGFRGYSRRLLESRKLALFRDVFEGYEFLFYISCRAARKGFKVCEVAVRRSYPESGAIPTKMTTFGSKLRVFWELLKCAVGWYDPWGRRGG